MFCCKRLLLTALCLLFLPTSAFAAVQVGAEAPNFSLQTPSGESVSLEDYRGKTVILEWFNKDCPYVQKHYKNGDMQALQAETAEDGEAVWLTIDSTHEGHRSFVSSKEYPKLIEEMKIRSTAVLTDPKGDVGRAFGAQTTPHMYVIDKDGKLLYKGAIDDNSSTFSNPKESKNYIRAALKNIGAGKAVEVAESKPYGCSIKYAN